LKSSHSAWCIRLRTCAAISFLWQSLKGDEALDRKLETAVDCEIAANRQELIGMWDQARNALRGAVERVPTNLLPFMSGLIASIDSFSDASFLFSPLAGPTLGSALRVAEEECASRPSLSSVAEPAVAVHADRWRFS
jgi:hypothetical protein